MPPAPIAEMISYGPSRVAAASGMELLNPVSLRLPKQGFKLITACRYPALGLDLEQLRETVKMKNAVQ
jgi:hypothetical protein